MQTPRVVLNVRVNPDALRRIDVLAEKHSMRRSDVVRRALALGLPALERDLARRRPAGEPDD